MVDFGQTIQQMRATLARKYQAVRDIESEIRDDLAVIRWMEGALAMVAAAQAKPAESATKPSEEPKP